MCSVRVPPEIKAWFTSVEALQAALYDHERVEIPVIDWKDAWHVRMSAHIHTAKSDIETLAAAMLRIGR